jgi:hypothetical protein
MTPFNQKFEDVGLTGAGRCLNYHILSLAEGAEGVLLPEVGEDEP